MEEIPQPSSTIEQYIKQVYRLQNGSDGFVSMKQISTQMKVAPATATAMIKKLDQQGFVHYVSHKGCYLSERGKDIGIRILRRHRLIEEFLCRILHYDWSEIHNEAEILEHAVSERFIGRLDALLGYPKFDPHGAPIPTESGTIHVTDVTCLAAYAGTGVVRIERVADKNSSILRYMKTHGIMPGSYFSVVGVDHLSEMIEMHNVENDNIVMLPLNIAQYVYIVSDNS